MVDNFELPRLVYVGDVPVEASYHGSALIYRLLQEYPVDQLAIFEAGMDCSDPLRRLENIPYRYLPPAFGRLRRTRLGPFYEDLRVATSTFRTQRLVNTIKSFAPTAILTVSHGASWITAACAARKLDVPLYLICHDEWAQLPSKIAPASFKENIFRRHYQAASSRLCVSPYMAKNFEDRFGVKGEILYPSRAKDAPQYDTPPELKKADEKLVCAYAGSINSSGAIKALDMLAVRLGELGAELHIFGPVDARAAFQAGLSQSNVVFRGLLPSAELIETLRIEADILFAPMSFDLADRSNMELCFPSKLTDYTLTGLPILIFGPEYSSAVKWAKAEPGVAEYVTNDNGSGLGDALERLADPKRRIEMGQCAKINGMRMFSYQTAWDTFRNAIREPQNSWT